MSYTKQNENVTSEVHQREKQTDNWSRFSVALHILLPVAGLALLLKQKHIFSRILLQLDRNCVSVLCPSFSRRENLLKWAGSRLPQTWSSQSRTLSGGISELWADGSLLCILINSAIPGACLNPHRHWKKPPVHAQALAYKYLGVVPVFTEKDLSGNRTATLEKRFLHYLNEIQEATTRLAERNELNRNLSTLYMARGMGLYTGEQHRKTVFYVYPNTKPTICNNSNIIIHIRGPYGTYGKAIIPKFHNDLFTNNDIKLSSDLLLTKNLLQNAVSKKRNPFIKNFSLPFMHYHKKHMGDNIVIHVTMQDERAKVTYIPKNYGMYEIIMISNGELVRGCPFNVHILNNTSGIQETLEIEEKEEEIPHPRKRKVISKTIDFINEQTPMADLQKKYNNKDTNRKLTHFKDILDEIPNQKFESDMENNKTVNQNNSVKEHGDNVIYNTLNLPVSKKQPMKILQDNRIEEETDEALSQAIVTRNDEIDSIKKNVDIITDDHFSLLDEKNLESLNENQKYKLPSTDTQDFERISNKDKQIEHETSKINCYEEKESMQNIVNNGALANINLKSNTATQANEGNGGMNKTHQEHKYNVINNKPEEKLTFNEYLKPIVVNKVHIPEKFTTLQKIPGTNQNLYQVDLKQFKNAINTSSKREIPRHLLRSAVLQEDDTKRITRTVQNYPMLEPKTIFNQIDDNDSGNDTISSLEDNEVKQNLVRALSRQKSDGDIEKLNAVPRRFFKNREDSNPISKRDNCTSPICIDHIVPEVNKNNEYKLISVAERRKMFAKQSAKDISHSVNSSFSEKYNEEVLKTPRQVQQFKGLSVLNVLSSLKETENVTKCKNDVLYSTKSLPNIPSVEPDYIFHNSVKERKNFWEKLSSSSISLNTYPESFTRRKPKKLTEEERLKLIWQKPNDSEAISNDIILEERTDYLERASDMCRSVDNILSTTNYNIYHLQDSKKYKSLDDSLDNCTVLSIEERKKILLKQNYEKEKVEKRKTLNNYSRANDIKNVTEKRNEKRKNDDIIFNPIGEKIKKYDSAHNQDEIQEKSIIKSTDDAKTKTNTYIYNTDDDKNKDTCEGDNTIDNNLQDLPKSQKLIKSQFIKAIKYFKNLEEKSLGKANAKIRKKHSRRHSFDIKLNNNKNKRKGGSLNLPNVSERFSINNLYEDVFRNKRGSFRGAANRSSLIEALGTFSRKENANLIEDNEDDIKYDIFKKRTKCKRRKSIRSAFDVYY